MMKHPEKNIHPTVQQLVLIVDDEEPIRKLLKARFEREGIQAVDAASGAEALDRLKHHSVAVVVTDVKMPGMSGLELLKVIKTQTKSPKVVVMTGHGEKSTAIESLRTGASDYLEKPFDLEEMVHSVKRTLNEYRLERENEDFILRLEARLARVEGKEEDQFWYVSKSPAMEPVNEWLKVLQRESMRATDVSVEEPSTLIIGESGTGKEGVARMIHAGSKRAKGPWIAINCANFKETLLESELFGHEKGSFTGASHQKRGLFELAKGGTLFLDEIGEMDAKLQASLLRVLQEKVFRRVGGSADIQADVRIVAATNQNLKQNIQSGEFREDLYHRVARVVIDLPPLRLRADDLIPMTEKFMDRAFKNRGKNFEGLSADAVSALESYRWPGNVRELLNIVERTALLWNENGKVTAAHIPLPKGAAAAPEGLMSAFAEAETTGETMVDFGAVQNSIESGLNYTSLKKRWAEAFEKEYLSGILAKHEGNVTAAAKESGIDRSNFLRLLRRHQINAQAYRRSQKAAA